MISRKCTTVFFFFVLTFLSVLVFDAEAFTYRRTSRIPSKPILAKTFHLPECSDKERICDVWFPDGCAYIKDHEPGGLMPHFKALHAVWDVGVKRAEDCSFVLNQEGNLIPDDPPFVRYLKEHRKWPVEWFSIGAFVNEGSSGDGAHQWNFVHQYLEGWRDVAREIRNEGNIPPKPPAVATAEFFTFWHAYAQEVWGGGFYYPNTRKLKKPQDLLPVFGSEHDTFVREYIAYNRDVVEEFGSEYRIPLEFVPAIFGWTCGWDEGANVFGFKEPAGAPAPGGGGCIDMPSRRVVDRDVRNLDLVLYALLGQYPELEGLVDVVVQASDSYGYSEKDQENLIPRLAVVLKKHKLLGNVQLELASWFDQGEKYRGDVFKAYPFAPCRALAACERAQVRASIWGYNRLDDYDSWEEKEEWALQYWIPKLLWTEDHVPQVWVDLGACPRGRRIK